MDVAELHIDLEILLNLEPGQPVTLLCRTSTANIYLKSPTADGRVRCIPELVQLRPIPYTIQGIYQGIEYGRYCYVVTLNRITNRLQHTPITAIYDRKLH